MRETNLALPTTDAPLEPSNKAYSFPSPEQENIIPLSRHRLLTYDHVQ